MQVSEVFTPYPADNRGGRWHDDRDNHGRWRRHHQHWDGRRWCDDDNGWRWH